MIGEPGDILLDTCALIWLAAGTGLKPAAVDLIVDAALTDRALIAAVFAWEIGLLSRKHSPATGRPVFEPDAERWFFRAVEGSRLRIVDLSAEMMVRAHFLPEPFHNDPADRLIVATARRLNVPIVTRDAKIPAYAEASHCAAIAC
jgi:PIN domain nuclease of toxin-antitoxin system